MILPIISYGTPVLRKKCVEIGPGYPGLQEFIGNMWETLYSANGQGLAAPQADAAIKLFVVDNAQVYKQLDEETRNEFFDGDCGIKETFINARIISSSEETWIDNEGCLSLPGLSENVKRPWSIEIEYFDRDFQKHVKQFSGLTARVVQHEYDHTQGILYIDYIPPLKKKIIGNKLKKIASGVVVADYDMKFVSKK